MFLEEMTDVKIILIINIIVCGVFLCDVNWRFVDYLLSVTIIKGTVIINSFSAYDCLFNNDEITSISGFCPEPEEMDNAVKSVPPQYEVGTRISYTCDQCYTGGGTSTCQCNKEWSPVQKCYCK